MIAQLPRPKYYVAVFLVDEQPDDPVARFVRARADLAVSLPAGELNACARAVRAARLDALVYPEVGIDPVCYWLAFAFMQYRKPWGGRGCDSLMDSFPPGRLSRFGAWHPPDTSRGESRGRR